MAKRKKDKETNNNLQNMTHKTNHSYQEWRSYLDQTPRYMAKSGFLFSGYQDYARCFFCGAGSRN